MTNLEWDSFFKALNNGHLPFAWQTRVVNHVLETGQWPEQIVAPTGTGKSFVVDAHIFLNAKYALGEGPRVPRRLNVVVNRRALVDNQATRAESIQEKLLDTDAPEVLKTVSSALMQLGKGIASKPLLVGHLRGALSNRTLPVDHLECCAVIASTPDMWGSRALFRGYGSTRFARPRETALLTMDSVLVLDEAHLNRQLLTTARRIRELQEKEQYIGVPRLQVVETTATAGDKLAGTSIGVEPADFRFDKLVAQRVNSSKNLELVRLEKWNGKPNNYEIVKVAVEKIRQFHGSSAGEPYSTIGCIVNHVDTALKIHQSLIKHGLRSVILVGRMRPFDVWEMDRNNPGLFTTDGSPNVDVVVATQTLEVGIDIDFHHLVTELAPASSLAQRFGRANRLGAYDDTTVSVLIPHANSSVKDVHPPYSGSDLAAGLEWLHKLAAGESANPQAILNCIPPLETPKRLLFQRLEWADALNFSSTSDSRFSEPDLALWLRDSLEKDQAMGGIVVRDPLPHDTNAAVELLSTVKPQDVETFPATLSVLRSIAARIKDDQSRRHMPNSGRARGFVYRNDEVLILSESFDLAPNDVLIVEPGIPFTTAGVASEIPEDKTPVSPVPLKGITVHVYDEASTDQEVAQFYEFASLDLENASSQRFKDKKGGSCQFSRIILDSGHKHEFVPVCAWYISESDEAIERDESMVQEWTKASSPVTLEQHQLDVANRTVAICKAVGLSDEFSEIVASAAAHHDDGKADSRFQTMLREVSMPLSETILLAKSWQSPHQLRNGRSRSNVPPRWRHEQLSAVIVAQKYGMETLKDQVRLRIVGCSHGRGRSSFQHVHWETICGDADENLCYLANELFAVGFWDELIESTNRNIGVYAISYLEAIERAADAQVSSEGR